jgi:hypothetical protein
MLQALALAAAATVNCGAFAQDFPNRSIRVVVTSSPDSPRVRLVAASP